LSLTEFVVYLKSNTFILDEPFKKQFVGEAGFIEFSFLLLQSVIVFLQPLQGNIGDEMIPVFALCFKR